MEIRPATDSDVDAVLAFWLEAAENDGRPVDSRAAVLGQLARDRDALVLAVDGERVVGSVIAGWDGWRAHLYRLAVHPDVRRRGVGRLLLEHAERRFTALGAVRIDAMVLEDNELGRSIWEAAGYRRQDDWRRWVKPLAG